MGGRWVSLRRRLYAYAAVRAVDPKAGETVAVSAAAGGVGTVVVQLLARRESIVLGIASPSNATGSNRTRRTVSYGEGLAERLQAATPLAIDALSIFGPEYVQLAVDLGIPRDHMRPSRRREGPGARREG